jgi:hypothetical protein
MGNLIDVVATFAVLPFVLAGYMLAWVGIGILGNVVFVFFPLAAIFMDTATFCVSRFDPSATPMARLRKAAKIFIMLFRVMADIKPEELQEPLMAWPVHPPPGGPAGPAARA